MGNSEVIIRLEGVTFSYRGNPRGRPVLDGLSLKVSRGQRLGLVGPNGSGKTTLFHLIMGLLEPAEGVLDLFGKRRRRQKEFREVRERIGLLFQDPDDQLFCPTVAEDVAFGPLNLGWSRKQALAKVREVLALLGLAGFETRLTYKLSWGERRLVSLATVLAMEPEVLLLDEPVTGLDEATVERVAALLNDSDFTYVIASHNADFLARTTGILCRLEQGRIIDQNR